MKMHFFNCKERPSNGRSSGTLQRKGRASNRSRRRADPPVPFRFCGVFHPHQPGGRGGDLAAGVRLAAVAGGPRRSANRFPRVHPPGGFGGSNSVDFRRIHPAPLRVPFPRRQRSHETAGLPVPRHPPRPAAV